MRFRSARLAASVTVVALAWTGLVPAHAAVPAIRKTVDRFGVQRIETLDNSRRIDINQLNMWVTNYGSIAFDLGTGNAGLEYPRKSGKTAIFASGLWLGCTVGGQVRTVVAEYSQEYRPGDVVGGVPEDPSSQRFKAWKVMRFTGNASDTAHLEHSAAELSDPRLDPLIHHSWSEYIANAKPYGAPTRFYHLNPSVPTDSIEGPDVLGDMMIWAVYNDLNPSAHTNDAGHSPPLGVEIQQSTFAFNRQGALGNTIFLKYKIINKGTNNLQNMFVSLWADVDLGGFTDDLVGCDVGRSLGYTYNATNNDQLYGIAPPAVGYDFFLGPTDTVGATVDTLKLYSFNKYINGTDPASRNETYAYMRGLAKNGSTVTDPTTGNATTFLHSGDPVHPSTPDPITGSTWLDANPADRRMMLSSGPFVMKPGDTQNVVGAIIIGQGSDRLSSITSLRFFDDVAQDAFDRNFDLPVAPPQPRVDVDQSAGSVTLSWGSASETNYSQPGYVFEGYNVYQGASQSGPWTRIATFDSINGVTTISDTVFNAQVGQIVPNFPVAFGSDNGISHTITITTDAVHGGPLHAGTQYYFAVTAYSWAPEPPFAPIDQKPPRQPRVLENAQQAIPVIPQAPAGGTNPGTATANVTYIQANPGQVPTTATVDAEVVNPGLVTGHVYKVYFTPASPPIHGRVGADTATVQFTWSVVDSNTGQVKVTSQLNQRGDEDYQVIDGIRFKVTGLYFPQLESVTHSNAPPHSRALMPGLVWSGNDAWFFGGGAGYGYNFFQRVDKQVAASSTLIPPTAPFILPNPAAMPDSFSSVEIAFTESWPIDQAAPPTTGQNAYRFYRKEISGLNAGDSASTPTGGRGYTYAGYVPVPFTVTDLQTGNQLEAAFVERQATNAIGDSTGIPQPHTHDALWLPDISADSLGAFEYILVIKRGYTGTEDPVIGVNGSINSGTLPVEYAIWPAYRDSGRVIDAGDAIDFNWATPATANDTFRVDTTPLVRNDKALAKGNLQNVRAVPNPYRNHSTYELNQFNRVLRFINLPETATIRIYSIAGDLVRTLQKTDPNSSTVDWDLQTTNRLPVGSGLYIFHVDSPGVGSYVGRVVVFMEKERLNNF